MVTMLFRLAGNEPLKCMLRTISTLVANSLILESLMRRVILILTAPSTLGNC